MKELNDDELFRSLPTSFAIFRVYSKDHRHDVPILEAAQFPARRRGGHQDEYVIGRGRAEVAPRQPVRLAMILRKSGYARKIPRSGH